MSRPKRHMTLSTPYVTDGRRKPKFWTLERQWQLADFLERGWPDARIGEQFGVSADAVMLARKDYGLRARSRIHHSARDVAVLLGIGCSKTVTRWIAARWLGAHRVPRGPYGQWSVRHDDLLAFLESPGHHHRWSPERINDPALREWAHEIWTGPFLTPGQVAWRLCVGSSTVNTWIRLGMLPAVRHGNWLVREADLDGFVPPCRRERRPRDWTAEEDMLLLTLRDDAASWKDIGLRLQRWPAACCNRHQRLTERRAA